MPEIAGLDSVLRGLSSLPSNLVDKRQVEFWQRLRRKLPPIPTGTRDGKKVILPAETFADEKNMENPELYAVFPYHRFGVGKEGLAMARDTFATRKFRLGFGWCQDAIQAAYLGLAEEAIASVVKLRLAQQGRPVPRFLEHDLQPHSGRGPRGGNHHGPAGDAPPGRRGQDLLLPAWPKDWDVEFKLHAPFKTTVECVYRGGKIESLKVTPQDRAKAVVRCEPQ